jgi:hypothetical protein
MLDDPKVGRLTDSQYRLMINLFLLAGDCEDDGYLPEKEDIRWRLRDPNNFDDDLETLLSYKVLEIEDGVLLVSKFSERQGAMSATERQQRRRDRLRKMDYYSHEPVTNCETEEDKEEIKKRIDKDGEEDKDTSPPNFIGEFVNAVRVQFTNQNQPEQIKDLVEDYGESVVLEAATWYGQNNPRNMGHALKSLDTVLRRGWNSKDESIEENNKKVAEAFLNGN